MSLPVMILFPKKQGLKPCRWFLFHTLSQQHGQLRCPYVIHQGTGEAYDLVTTTEAEEHRVKSGFLLDIIISKGVATLQLLPSEDEALRVWRDAFLVLGLRHGRGGGDDGIARKTWPFWAQCVSIVNDNPFISDRVSTLCDKISDPLSSSAS
ncbi:uncharacterized protein LOC120264314 [Dioscorea cayenensis subsp. rotundata]|uniref:Uncharacterized protein LOC120264314 n=1 Tax=Dioscorea cayennensis subsp. rotundata TaxID=55577 RepID=A0AB40BN83_DIOCR|nr:uncharacterized protein LOC120264314 [Dioscorea cayenensis subsp. rotundata]